MKKVLLTNNSILINKDYDIVYTDSPYVVESNERAVYLDTFIDQNFNNKIENIRNKGHIINNEIIKSFFPNYENRKVKLIDIVKEYTNIYINLSKLFRLIDLHSKDEITVGITVDELSNDNSQRVIDRFENVYYGLAKLFEIKNLKLVCKDLKLKDLDPKDKPINSWFLRLIDLDKKVLTFNLKKKIGLIKSQNTKVYVYNQNTIIREIEPYLYDKGVNYTQMPEVNYINYNNDYKFDEKKLKEILDKSFENNFLENKFKLVIFEIYKKIIKRYLEKEIFTKKFISKLDKSIPVILTNALKDTFDSLIFTKQLQDSGFKIVEVFHGLTKSFISEPHIKDYETDVSDMVLCFSRSEKRVFERYDPKSKVHPISTVQETKKKRLMKLQRFYVNKMLNISDKKNVLYPSIIYPYNNANEYGFKLNDRENYNLEKKIITSLSQINKRSIYKTYPNRCFVDPNTLIKYAEKLNNIKVISEKFDFRYINTVGDIFILAPLAGSSTLMWMLGLNRPIIYLDTKKLNLLNNDSQVVLKKVFITVDIDKNNWEDDFIKLLNKPYDEILKMWKTKQIYREEFDEEWLLGKNLHAGKLGAHHIKKFIIENKEKLSLGGD